MFIFRVVNKSAAVFRWHAVFGSVFVNKFAGNHDTFIETDIKPVEFIQPNGNLELT